MATLALAREFLAQFDSLEAAAKNKVQEHASFFAQMTAQELRAHKGIHLERHKNAADPRARTIRFDRNHRGILLDAGNDDLFVLVKVGTHDETDRWMANNRFKVNAATGALEVLDVGAIEAHLSRVEAQPAVEGLFDHRRDKDFVNLGVEPDLVPTLRALTTEDALSGLLGLLPEGQCEAVLQLLGEESVEAIYAEIAGRQASTPVDTEDLVAAIEAPASQTSFHVVDGQDELSEILSQPLKQWRVFLHPSQRRLVEKNFKGPARVTGGAGTGKTVVAIHRAKHLAEQLDDPVGKPILFTTFTKNLAEAIQMDLTTLGGTDVLDSIEVMNVDRLANRIVQEAEDTAPLVIKDRDLKGLWQQVIDERGLSFSPEFLHNEWEQVILAQDLRSRSDYFTANRAGRGIPLDRRSRAKVWQAVEALTQLLVNDNRRTYLQIAAAAEGYAAGRTVKPYRHVIVDEAQDLHETQWRLLRAVVDEEPNDIFLVGDSHQRIYDRRSSLSKVGINIVGRSKKLKINYRTTHEILSWSMAMLGEGSFDDLDGGADRQDFAGYHSYRCGGPRPELSGHSSKKAQLDALVDKVVSWIDDGVHEESIGVAARTSASFDPVRRALEDAGVRVCQLPAELPRAVGVRLGTMHRMKGLEFERMAIVDADDQTVPLAWALTDHRADPVQHCTDLQREKCLLYVAATRARDELWIGWSGKPSRFFGTV